MPQPSYPVVMDFARTAADRTWYPIAFVIVLDKHMNLFGQFILFHFDHLPGIANLKEFAIKLYACWVSHAPILSFFPPIHHKPGRANLQYPYLFVSFVWFVVIFFVNVKLLPCGLEHELFEAADEAYAERVKKLLADSGSILIE
jgi:hypothetical protein